MKALKQRHASTMGIIVQKWLEQTRKQLLIPFTPPKFQAVGEDGSPRDTQVRRAISVLPKWLDLPVEGFRSDFLPWKECPDSELLSLVWQKIRTANIRGDYQFNRTDLLRVVTRALGKDFFNKNNAQDFCAAVRSNAPSSQRGDYSSKYRTNGKLDVKEMKLSEPTDTPEMR